MFIVPKLRLVRRTARQGGPWRLSRRAGVSLLIVMLALSTSLALTYGFLESQATSTRLVENSLRGDAALLAAQTGAAAALRDMQSPTWTGITGTLARDLSSDARARTSYSVQYLPYTPAAGETVPADAPWRVLIRSTGTWQSLQNSLERSDRIVEVVARLEPRVAGRTITAGDNAAALDVVPNPNSYDQIQSYVLFGDGTGTTLILDPGTRLDGPVWLRDDLDFFDDGPWSSTPRNELLSAISSRLTSTSGGVTTLRHPHPFGGPLKFNNYPAWSIRNDLDRIDVPWDTTSTIPTRPTVTFSNWQTYCLYEGGFLYNAVNLSSTLLNTTLRPTADNPLGIFYRNGSLLVRDGVTIQGTLVCTGQVTLDGEGIHLAAYNWRNAQGVSALADAKLWPRMPAIVADEVWVERENTAIVEGAVIVRDTLSGAGGTFEYASTGTFTLTGTATATPSEQPYSDVQILGTPSLSGLSGSENYSLWVDNGATGSWYPIVSVTTSTRKLRVRGELDFTQARTIKIGRTREWYLDIHGPVCGTRFDINRCMEWDLTSSVWTWLRNNWEDDDDYRRSRGWTRYDFSTWLENPANFTLLWYSPYTHQTYGLRLEPTCHLRPTSGYASRWSPPLFRPFPTGGSTSDYAGYRWEVISWKELP